MMPIGSEKRQTTRKKSLRSGPEVSQEGGAIRQEALQTAQPHRDHVRAVEGLVARQNLIRPMPENFVLHDHARRNRLVLAVKLNEML